jgi:hypothetical protein
MMAEIPRIGREPNPAERSYRHAVDHPEVAEYHGRCLCEAETGQEWADVPEVERRTWIDHALDMMRAHADTTGDWPPPEPDGGLPLPAENVA